MWAHQQWSTKDPRPSPQSRLTQPLILQHTRSSLIYHCPDSESSQENLCCVSSAYVEKGFRSWRLCVLLVRSVCGVLGVCVVLKAAGESEWMWSHGVKLRESANRNNVVFNLLWDQWKGFTASNTQLQLLMQDFVFIKNCVWEMNVKWSHALIP